MQYRVDFFIDALMSLFWTASALVPLLVLFGDRQTVVGWTWAEALVVVAFFTFLKGVLDGGIQPALQNVVEQIRKGTFDFVLLKPADTQLLVSTSRFEIWKAADVIGGMVLLGWALSQLGRWPGPLEIASTVALLVAAVAILYSLWILVVSLAFFVVKIDNLSYLFSSIYDAARWPSSVYRGILSFVFTFVIPLAVMTTFPALSILGRLETIPFVSALVGAFAFSWVARQVWKKAIGRYTSAGG